MARWDRAKLSPFMTPLFKGSHEAWGRASSHAPYLVAQRYPLIAPRARGQEIDHIVRNTPGETVMYRSSGSMTPHRPSSDGTHETKGRAKRPRRFSRYLLVANKPVNSNGW